MRARIFIEISKGSSLSEIGLLTGYSKSAVGAWIRRWKMDAPNKKTLRLWLEDRPRCGAPPKFTLDQRCRIIALACESPADHGLPLDCWTGSDLRLRVIQTGIVGGISLRHIHRILSDAELKPHRHQYWLGAKADPQRDQKISAINQVYQEASEQSLQGVLTFCLDEMSGIQALERIFPEKPLRPGSPRKIEYEYKRHGTQCLLGIFNVADGTLDGSVRATRTEADFLDLLIHLVQTHPEASGMRIVLDNLNTHQSESLVRYIGQMEGTSEEALGKKGEHGILKNQQTRAAYLSDRTHRLSFYYTPRHASWMNQIEILFGLINRKAIGQTSFASKEELKQRIEEFIEYYNRHLAKPMRWSYGTKPLKS